MKPAAKQILVVLTTAAVVGGITYLYLAQKERNDVDRIECSFEKTIRDAALKQRPESIAQLYARLYNQFPIQGQPPKSRPKCVL